MSKSFWLKGAILVVAIAVAVFLIVSLSKDKKSAGEFDKVPELSFKDYAGNNIALTDFAGKPVVVNSWAAWCPFCKDELPDFAKVQKEFGGKVVIIAIDRAESLGVSKQYSDQLGVTDELIFLLDPDDSFYKAIGGFSMPETIFADKDGNILEHKRGPMSAEEISRKVENIL